MASRGRRPRRSGRRSCATCCSPGTTSGTPESSDSSAATRSRRRADPYPLQSGARDRPYPAPAPRVHPRNRPRLFPAFEPLVGPLSAGLPRARPRGAAADARGPDPADLQRRGRRDGTRAKRSMGACPRWRPCSSRRRRTCSPSTPSRPVTGARSARRVVEVNARRRRLRVYVAEQALRQWPNKRCASS
jgi:hypothetical protein